MISTMVAVHNDVPDDRERGPGEADVTLDPGPDRRAEHDERRDDAADRWSGRHERERVQPLGGELASWPPNGGWLQQGGGSVIRPRKEAVSCRIASARPA